MFPSSQTYTVEKTSTLREFVEALGPEVLYAYDRRVVITFVNRKRGWPSARLKLGDKVTVLPIISGG